MQPLLQILTKPIIRLNLVRKQRITSHLRGIKDIQERGSRGLGFIRNVRVPGDAGIAVREEGFEIVAGGAVSMDDCPDN
jgi:hypothetical protein